MAKVAKLLEVDLRLVGGRLDFFRIAELAHVSFNQKTPLLSISVRDVMNLRSIYI